MITPPSSVDCLMARVNALCGKTLGQIAMEQGVLMPENQHRKKGWVGQLIERVLGATAGSLPRPDFEHLSIELKTLPLNEQGRPKESTFVASIDLLTIIKSDWQHSLVKKKLAHVLWLPLEGSVSLPLGARRIGQGFLWRPKQAEEERLARDWNELVDMIALGQLESIDARLGEVMQMRPKAANARSLCKAFAPDGGLYSTLPRGFYLRPGFTNEILINSTQ